eukprot:1156299-Pelagomonas_calceolata.AAC.4
MEEEALSAARAPRQQERRERLLLSAPPLQVGSEGRRKHNTSDESQVCGRPLCCSRKKEPISFDLGPTQDLAQLPKWAQAVRPTIPLAQEVSRPLTKGVSNF